MTEKHDSMAYGTGETKRTNRAAEGGVVIGTIPTKYLRFSKDEAAAFRLARLNDADVAWRQTVDALILRGWL